MTAPSNLNKIDLNKNSSTYQNNFINPAITVSPAVNDAVIATFERITGNRGSAQNLASAVIYTSQQQGLNPMEVLQEFNSLPTNELNAYLAVFLNLSRVGTSFLGIRTAPQTNKYVARAIKA